MDFFDGIKQEADRLSESKGGEFLAKFVKMPKENGEVSLRLLPPAHGMKLPFQSTRLHMINGKSIHCRKELQGGKWVGKPGVCPACDVYNHLWSLANRSTGETAQGYIDKARAIKPIERFYYNAVVRNDPTQEGVKIFSTGKTIHKLIMRACVGDERKKPLGNIFDVTGKEGRDLLIVKEMVGGFPRYNDSEFNDDPTPLATPEEIEKLLAECHDLDPLRNVKSAEFIDRELQIHFGAIPDDEGGIDPTKYNIEGVVSAIETTHVDEIPVVSGVIVEAPTHSAATPTPTTPASVPAAAEPEPEEQMADTDFMKELNEL